MPKKKITDNDWEEHIIMCDCHDLNHVARFSLDNKEEVYFIEFGHSEHRNLGQRIWESIKYIWKGEYLFADIAVDKEALKKLRRFLAKVK